ncbi:excinuclease ABC subunit UvrA [Bifidobacterium sp.]|jgi:excinuclease ABC subunit A|uniref:excinuclease ABC subunit UvrA n=1 Tax=Bifidobacterium sp. TaxID=41200 RepID=UPI0025C321DD|nr:excinuclease ABC subunit UvrA [Bifidobacterium sp.]MCH4209620.1 excinuclease ABC subunit UvrA [Bifidobacterium sp.]MCI1224853.1 excinuclease ABC subunit UvrA [Bifidobacterium sp.]
MALSAVKAQERPRTADGIPQAIEVRGARVHNLADIDISIPLNRLVGVAGVSGSGKSSLALGVLYAEGSRRYLDALSTYTRRRMTQAERAQVDSVRFLPPALALRQRPSAGGVRSTFGTSTELLNVLRLMFSRLAAHRCPNGHYQQPSMAVAAEMPMRCGVCGAPIDPPGAEALAFNSAGACPRCHGTGIVREVDDGTLVPDDSLTIDEGAVVPWRTFGFNVQPDIVRELGVRTDVPWRELSEHEKDIVFNGPEEKKHITLTSVKGVHKLNFTFRNARLTVTKELERAGDERRLSKVEKFLVERICPDCRGTRLGEAARAPRINGDNLAEVTSWSLRDILVWSKTITPTLPVEMQPMAHDLIETLQGMGARLMELGLGYLTLDRSSASLSTGERQRAQLARAVRNETTGVLYVLDEPSTGLHPANIEGLIGVMRDLLAAGNSVVFVDHDVRVLRAADYFIEMGPGAGGRGGRVLAQGAPQEIERNPDSRIAGFLSGQEPVLVRHRLPCSQSADPVHWLRLSTTSIHTVHALNVAIPRGRMTAVTGVSGSGKTTMVLESLVPALQAAAGGSALPAHVSGIEAGGIDRVRLVDSTPIGINVRSTLATYAGIMDMLRKAFAGTDAAKAAGLKVSAFSYNTGSLRCPQCDGTGQISLDVQFLPDVTIACPVCGGSRYQAQANGIRIATPTRPEGMSLPKVLDLEVDEALEAFANSEKPRDIHAMHARSEPSMISNAMRSRMHRALQTLSDLGLGYLKLGEDTPSLSGGEAQRLKLSNELGKRQETTLFVLDEPTTGLHPLDVRTLIRVLQRLIEGGATVIFIEHDLDMIANADYVIDMGPGGGQEGGRVVAVGTPDEIARDRHSVTGRYLAEHMN